MCEDKFDFYELVKWITIAAANFYYFRTKPPGAEVSITFVEHPPPQDRKFLLLS